MNFAYLISERTVPAFPLGQPEDGRARYGMTQEMARAYRWIAANRPHDDWFRLHFRDMAAETRESQSNTHLHVQGLVERGWLDVAPRLGGQTTYRLVHPVKVFKVPPDAP